MSVLGVVIRVWPTHRQAVAERLARTPGVDLGPDGGDGRLIAVIESTADTPAALIMNAITQWPEVHNLSLVYEHSDPDESTGPVNMDFRAWRMSPQEFARRLRTADAPLSQQHPTSAASGAGEKA